MKVLIVDDSSFIGLVCTQALVKAGHEVVGEAYDGLDGVAKAEQLKPDLVIMDIALPKKNGIEATKMILELLPKTAILGISAIDEDWVKEKALRAGCFDFLVKPFETKQLIEYINRIKIEDGELKYG